MFCDHCGRRLLRHDGELYCPDCTSYTLTAPVEEADEGAHALRLAPVPPPDDGPPDEAPPW